VSKADMSSTQATRSRFSDAKMLIARRAHRAA
jgi:hypothetical protein